MRLLEEEEESGEAVALPGLMGDTQLLAEEVLEQVLVWAGQGLPISLAWCGLCGRFSMQSCPHRPPGMG